MKKIFRTVAALAVVMFAGCTQDLDNEVLAPVGGTTVTVGLEDSRTYLGDLVDGARKVFWSSNDKIAVNGVASTAIERTEDHTSANFTFEGELAYPYSILYPAEAYKDASTVTLATNDIPMAGYLASEGSAVLHHLAAVVRLQVKLPAESTHAGHKLNKVEIRGVNGEQMVGDFTIDYQTETLVGASTADADKVKVVNVGKTLSAEEAIEVFVVVPAQEYAGGLSVRLLDDAGHYMDVKSAPMTIAKSEIKAMPVLEFAPTGTIIGVEIKTAAEFVAFAKAYNAGDYFHVEPFVVHITDDIVFDDATNAEWVAIGNVFGADNKLGLADGATNYWHGYLEGNGHTIKNWVSSRPLFAYTGGGSMIENLTIDASCTLTANYAVTENSYLAPFVNYHRGNLVNCHNYANISVVGAWATGSYIGGLVGRTVIGSVRECTNHGNITIAADYATNEKTLYVAGISGYISNADGEVLNCTNYGKIVAEDGAKISEADTEDWDSYVYMGGIVGKAEGNIADCVNDAAATITTQMEAVCHQIGGIVGCSENAAATVRRCTNLANINFNTLPTRTADADGRYGYIGGIAGQTVNDITDCANYGSINSTTSLKMLYIGGIVGLVSKVTGVEHVEFQNNINDKDVVIQATGAARVLYIGGLIGENNCSTTIVDLTNDTGSILGTIKGANVENSTTYGTLSFGGYVGATVQPMTIKGTTEGANIELDYTAAKSALRHCAGGVIGSSTVAGLVVENAESNNYIKVTAGSAAHKYVETGMGGILGYALKGGVTVTNATSNCSITWNKGNAKSNGYPCYTGGIVGYIVEGDATITGCHNTADLKNCFYNNNGYAAGSKPCSTGGILGGFGWLTEAGALTITNCSNSGKLYAMRGCLGGITGSVRNATISGCTFTEGEIYNAGSDANLQGVVGGISSGVRNSTITDCTVKANMIAGINGSVLYRAGGIAGVMEGASSIDNCAYFGTISHYNPDAAKVEYYGGIAGMAENTTAIKNSKFGGTIWGTAITESNYENYIANMVTNGGTEYEAQIENCTYWDGN